MISIDSIGYYSDAPNSQRRADSTARYPSTGDFVAVEGNEASKALVDRVLGAFLNYASISAHGAALRPDSEGAGASDDWAFCRSAIPRSRSRIPLVQKSPPTSLRRHRRQARFCPDGACGGGARRRDRGAGAVREKAASATR
jgi:hypothetical protein